MVEQQLHTSEASATPEGGRATDDLTAKVNLPQGWRTHLIVSEIFGPTIQGEGASAGRNCVFLRLGGCNLSCSWCDTPYTWDWKNYNPSLELKRQTIGEVEQALNALVPTPSMLVISGGEPLLQSWALQDLIALCLFNRIEIETNGTKDPSVWNTLYTDSRVFFNVSPKLPHSGDSEFKRINPEALKAFVEHPHSIFKFVCIDHDDLDWIDIFLKDYNIPPTKVWVMPEGIAPGLVRGRARYLIQAVIRRGWNLTLRSHLDLFGPARGH